MENLDFSEEEIQQQLEALGYNNIPKHRLREFKRDLDDLIRVEKSKSQASSSDVNSCHSQSTSYKSPPAFTKVKVQQDNTAAFHTEVFLPPDPSDQQRQVLTSTYSRDNSNFGAGGRQQFYDSYAQHSVSPRYPRPSAAPHRLGGEADLSDGPLSPFVVSQSSTPDRGAPGRPLIKRKVLRKRHGQIHVCDESTHSEDSGEVSGLEDRLGGLEVSLLSSQQQASDLGSEGGDRASQSDRASSEASDLHSAFQSYIRGMARSRSESDIRSRPKSFIRPMMDHPHTRNLKKTDPVTKYFQYKQDWEMFKAPGEKDRKALHWAIREQLQYQPPPPRPRRTFVPNTYVVPTDKKRLALRWEVRHDLANGLLPPKASYRL